ncbi:MAG: hypothetical protein BWK80_01920 [Desulfobacteraceae bacterium IS3]|nr:MAG: hypothetical protein BWK80_01920 [Desulfobacteraceae bacterium IS3]
MKAFFQRLRSALKRQIIPVTVFLLGFLIFLGYLTHNILHTVLPGEAGVTWSRFQGGTRVDYVYPEGMHAILPWDKFYIYNVRIQQISPEIDVLTKNGLQVHLYLSIRYAPKYKLLGLLHKKIGPDYPNKVIIPEVESVLREVIGTMEAEQIYTTGRAVIIEAINLAIERVAQRYIDVDGVLIKRIELPESVAGAIRYKIEQKQMIEAHQFIAEKEKIEADRKRTEGQGIRDQMKIISEAIPKQDILQWLGIRATLELSKSANSKVVVIGAGKNGLPLIGSIPMVQPDLFSSGDQPLSDKPSSPSDTKELLPDSLGNTGKTAVSPSEKAVVSEPSGMTPEPRSE